MLEVGIEPTTYGLRVRRSTAELPVHYLEDTLVATPSQAWPSKRLSHLFEVVYHQSNGGSGQTRTDVLRLKVGC